MGLTCIHGLSPSNGDGEGQIRQSRYSPGVAEGDPGAGHEYTYVPPQSRSKFPIISTGIMPKKLN